MKKYKEATSARGIAKCLINYLDIKYYKMETIADIIIAPKIRDLLKRGVIEDIGDSNFTTNLRVKQEYYEEEKQVVKKNNFSSQSIIPFLENRPNGATIVEFREYFDIKEGNSSLHSKLERRCKKVNVRNEKGRIYSRFFSPYKKVNIPVGETLVDKGEVNKARRKGEGEYIKSRLKEALKYMYGRILVQNIFPKKKDLSFLKSILQRFFPKYTLGEVNEKLYIYYKKYYEETRKFPNKYEESMKIKTDKVLELLYRLKKISAHQIVSELGFSKKGAYDAMKAVLKEDPSLFLCRSREVGDKCACYYLSLGQLEMSEVMKALPERYRWRLNAHGIDENTFTEILKNNPGISTEKLEGILRERYGETFIKEVSSMLKVLIEKDIVANIGKGYSRKLYVQDGSYKSTVIFQIPAEIYLDHIRLNEGLTIKELYDMVKPSCHIATLYNKLKNLEGVCFKKVYSLSTKKEFYRIFSSKDKVVINEGEVDLDLMG